MLLIKTMMIPMKTKYHPRMKFVGDEDISSKASKSNVIANKRPKILGGIYDMFDLKGREGVDLAIERFFLACGIPFNAARSPYFEQMVRAINDGPSWYKPPGYMKL